MTEPTCIRCGPKGLPVTLVEVVGHDGETYTVCLRCHIERERIEPTARKGGTPAMPLRAGTREWKP